MDSKQTQQAEQKMKIVQAIVSTEELTYLLNLVGATRAFGIDDSLWKDDGEVSLGMKLDRGFDRLVQNGWLYEEEGAGTTPRYTINPNLILMAATLADPDVVIVTKRYLQHQEVQTVTHYVTEQILLEQVLREDGTYRLMCLPAHSAMLERLTEALNLPTTVMVRKSDSVNLNWTKVSALDQFLMHRNGHDGDSQTSNPNNRSQYAQIREVGIDEAEAHLLDRIFSNASPVAKIEIGRTFGARLLSLRTMMLFDADGETWAVHSSGSAQTLAVKKLDASTFSALVATTMTKLANIKPVRL